MKSVFDWAQGRLHGSLLTKAATFRLFEVFERAGSMSKPLLKEIVARLMKG
jgi:hypothetical protein